VNIIIKTIPHSDQIYPTVGDWRFDEDGTLQIRVSELGDWKKELLVARHELDEAVLCKAHGITDKQVDEFDMSESALFLDEPGEDATAPYHMEHMLAYASELSMMVELGVDYTEYCQAIDSLP
jgi:hypothetical protein